MNEKEKRLKKIEERVEKKLAAEEETKNEIREVEGVELILSDEHKDVKDKKSKKKSKKDASKDEKKPERIGMFGRGKNLDPPKASSKSRTDKDKKNRPLIAGADKKKVSADIVTKMIVIGVVSIALILLLASVYVAVVSGGKSKKHKATSESEVTTVADDGEDTVIDYERIVAVVKHIDLKDKKLVVHDINKFKNKTFKVPNGIELKNAYGDDIALSQFDDGDIVEIKYPKKGNEPKYIKITATAWEKKKVTDLVIDAEAKTMKLKNDNYKYTDAIVALENGKPFDLSKLSVEDEVTIRGYSNMVWSVDVTGRHGSVRLVNYDLFLGGTLDIVGHVSRDIVSGMVFSLPSGSYSVSVSKEGFPPVLRKITVVADEETVLDLGNIQPKVGEVEFVLKQKDAVVYIDDKKIDPKEKQVLNFGSYKVKAEVEGFAPWEGKLLVNQAYMKFKVDLSQAQNYIYFNEPKGADVYFDGVLVGTIPTKTVFESGSHKIQLRKDGYRTSETFNYLWGAEDEGKDKYLIFPDLVPLVTTPKKGEGLSTDSNAPTTIGEEVYTAPEGGELVPDDGSEVPQTIENNAETTTSPVSDGN